MFWNGVKMMKRPIQNKGESEGGANAVRGEGEGGANTTKDGVISSSSTDSLEESLSSLN